MPWHEAGGRDTTYLCYSTGNCAPLSRSVRHPVSDLLNLLLYLTGDVLRLILDSPSFLLDGVDDGVLTLVGVCCDGAGGCHIETDAEETGGEGCGRS